MSRWSFRFLLFYIAVLFVQPQNRFPFLVPFRLGQTPILIAVSLHLLACLSQGRPLLRFGPATRLAFVLLPLGLVAQYFGPLVHSTAWNGFIDQLVKSCIVMILIEAMADSVQRVWAVLATMLIATLWWHKAGLRLSMAGATWGVGDRIMGANVAIIENPNGFAYMMSVMLPIYLLFYQMAKLKFLRLGYLAMALSGMFIIFQSGSRTGLLCLVAVLAGLMPKYFRQYLPQMVVLGVAGFFVIGLVSPGNLRRFQRIPATIAAAFAAPPEDRDITKYPPDEHSAIERRFKNMDTWAMIKEHPVLGLGMNPPDWAIPDDRSFARGQVHNELLMAGRQMGIPGMAGYLALLAILFFRGRSVERMFRHTWPEVSDMGWTFKLQALAILVGGMFSPLPWNAVTLILAGAAGSLGILATAYAPALAPRPEATATGEPFGYGTPEPAPG